MAFDTDVLSGIMRGYQPFLSKLNEVPVQDQAVPIIVIEEIMRGRLNMIRRAESGAAALSLERAYHLFEQTFRDFQTLQVLPYTQAADELAKHWRQQKIRLGTNDLRIAAICQSQGATLVSRNRRDFERIPNLDVAFWE